MAVVLDQGQGTDRVARGDPADDPQTEESGQTAIEAQSHRIRAAHYLTAGHPRRIGQMPVPGDSGGAVGVAIGLVRGGGRRRQG
ncbi:hypothetical protein GCM10027456_00470 [Kineosporia babensis]